LAQEVLPWFPERENMWLLVAVYQAGAGGMAGFCVIRVLTTIQVTFVLLHPVEKIIFGKNGK